MISVRNTVKENFCKRPGCGKLIPFPILLIPFPVLKINFKLLGINEEHFVKEFF